ncbi:SDR family NAD(P)-dependent oxidoreductase [Rufibacter immobilis]|uniref:SDR family NAD(P)-dependent oxidoreductase n=1 Tax=Rufibacter immobilis TaxID=1348778 RepID=A0A3M9MXX0_9BACT|nr:SDR family NAD(P)-dependent oxidoreductase [Rufibacter immobilis]RNI30005.1 SDR family NAD(P)-dependent oxidoreductase [Rufibacter immobilis]
MKLAGNTVLVTGGATGIGLAIAERFLNAGSTVIICGRRSDKLNEAKEKHPALHTIVCDVAQESDRIALLEQVTAEFPQLNVLVNNAGIQRRVNPVEVQEEWAQTQQELVINVEAPIHLCHLFIPHLRKQDRAAIVNVTSGLAFTPAAFAPVYCATKAALHSYTMSLRFLLSKTSVEVLEIVPPAVNTDLGGPGLHTFGAPLQDFADAVMQRLDNGELEVGYGSSEERRKASREENDAFAAQMNARMLGS